MPNGVNNIKNDITDDTSRRCAEINVIKTKKSIHFHYSHSSSMVGVRQQ